MIVVPAFAEGKERHPPVIPGAIARGEPSRAPHVRGGVNQPGDVKANDNAQADAPQREGKAADGVQQHGENYRGDPVIGVQPHVKTVF